MHVGFHSIMQRFIEYQKAYRQCLDFWNARKAAVSGDWRSDKEAKRMAQNMDHFQGLLDGLDISLRNPEFLQNVLAFAKLCMVWMEHVISEGNAEYVFSSVPVFMVRDISEILDFILRMNTDLLFNDLDLVPTSIDWCVRLLNGGHKLVKSSLIRSKLSSYLEDLLSFRNHSVHGKNVQYAVSASKLMNQSVIGEENLREIFESFVFFLFFSETNEKMKQDCCIFMWMWTWWKD